MAPTWLRTSAPTPTPISTHRTKARSIRPNSAQVSDEPSCVSIPYAARKPAAGATDETMPTTPNSAPMTMPTRSFAQRTRPRFGVARNVGVRVLCRNSVVTISVPMRRGKT